VFKDEKVRSVLARQPHHILVVVLNPTLDDLAVHQFKRYQFLLLTKRFEEGGFLEGVFRRRCPPSFGIWIPVGSAKRHAGIVHNAPLQSLDAQRTRT